MAADRTTARFGVVGVAIRGVAPGSPAADSGLVPMTREAGARVRLGDVIVGIDGEPTTSVNDVLRVLDRHEVGDRVTLRVRRNGQERDVELPLLAVE